MNSAIADIIRGKIDTLCFVDKISGLVRPVSMILTNNDNVKVEKIFPVACSVTHQECQAGKYMDLVPNSKYRSVIYFEENSLTFIERIGNIQKMESSLKLVGWLNLKKTDCVVSDKAILLILSAIPSIPFSDDIYDRISIVIESEERKNKDIFSKYSYEETVNQYLLYPYDYFALNIKTTFSVNTDCIEQFNCTADETC